MDCGSNRRKKAVCSNTSGLVWTRPNIMRSTLVFFLVRRQTSDVFDVTQNALLK